ncbi:late competence development ComFB family protein [Oscillatoria sp. FACHB-1407]|uniref:late competence development ComFB family protein n=1 Tax=Oscillatoria sp. FACHB-1407 TaxID=2692847 RepID=UPI00168978C5|nr:late competence development ComFB family protein [Oscillatoria sp. FACHB-1407]MBD2461282.1 late competence development ComFB family protein [Oscillatoria sp. FACHB-1407]
MGAYKNAMEVLVEEEVDRQVKALPARSTVYINRLELVAYALNQLPSLYATSERGFDYQLQRGRSKFQEQITQAVRRALAAIRRDPIRTYAPLQAPHQSAPLREVLHELRLLLKNDKVDWETLPKEVERALSTQRPPQQKGMTWDARYEATTHSYPNRRVPPALRHPNYATDNTVIDSPVTQLQSPPPPPPSYRPAPRPNQDAAKRVNANRYDAPETEAPASEYGWDDPFYNI